MPDDITEVASDWITTAEAQRLTGYHEDSLRRLARDGTVRAEKRFGIVWLYDRADLLKHRAEARPGTKWRREPTQES